MMEGLIVWAALGPVLAFVGGMVVVAWCDDEEDNDLPLLDYLHRTDGSSRSAGRSSGRPARSCLQCGRWEERP
ncbi:hypothetical protein FFK22_039045 [Mycobacterium sp. KBS0706]|uniref:hypothetical protein n=1 Tax=Mycobacterium sp. KBS0706 TaxID=2578109 RepID=UPI00110FF00C|nr:hypothetical protein [Mycobacterium sp. KBS0706]TSD83197.1 hypothetical protein FFK22_039045 [Mycobacterium sp. KBS0706]